MGTNSGAFTSKFWHWQLKQLQSQQEEDEHHRPPSAAAPPKLRTLLSTRVILTILHSSPDPNPHLRRHLRRLSPATAAAVLSHTSTTPASALLFFHFAASLPAFRHSPLTVNALLTTLLRHPHRHLHAYHFFRLRLLGHHPVNHVTYSLLLKGLCNSGEFHLATKLLGEMKAGGVSPAVVPHNTLIRGLCNSGNLSLALIHFRKMIQDYDCAPNSFTYTLLIDALCKSGQPNQAHELFREMTRCGCEPGIVSYNTLIDGFRKSGELDQVMILLREMCDRGHRPDVVTYTMVLDTFCRCREYDAAYRLLLLLVDGSLACEPNEVTYNALLTGLARAGYDRTPEALLILSQMIRHGPRPGPGVYRTLILMLCRNDKLDEAHQLLLSMFSRGCSPDEASYRILIVSFAAAGRVPECVELLERMLRDGHELETGEMNLVIESVTRACGIEEGYHLVCLTIQGGASGCLDTGMYDRLIRGFCSAGKPGFARGLLNQMVCAGLKPNGDSYSCLVKSFCDQRKFEAAYLMLLRMINTGCFPDENLYSSLNISKEKAAELDRNAMISEMFFFRSRPCFSSGVADYTQAS